VTSASLLGSRKCAAWRHLPHAISILSLIELSRQSYSLKEQREV
jgi:hypothetical protein